MSCYRIVTFSLLLLALPFASCGNTEETAQGEPAGMTRTIDACSLLTQEEVDSLFPEPIGPGSAHSLNSNVQGCAWPAEGLPQLMLQIVPAPASVRADIDPGEGYRVVDLERMSGKAAVAVQLADPQYGLTEGVAILAVKRGKHMITLSPVHLDIQEGTRDFDRLKELADLAAQRL